jgi:toxin ParE1/3/4
MPFQVRFTAGARRDLRSLHEYICANDSIGNADRVVREIVQVTLTLQELPERGVHPPELVAMGNHSWRQLYFKPYRILYRIRGKAVYAAVIADGRRNMASLLAKRLIGR